MPKYYEINEAAAKRAKDMNSLLFHSLHDLHQLKKAQSHLRVSLATNMKYFSL